MYGTQSVPRRTSETPGAEEIYDAERGLYPTILIPLYLVSITNTPSVSLFVSFSTKVLRLTPYIKYLPLGVFYHKSIKRDCAGL